MRSPAAAYLIYRRRIELGLPGDSHSDWARSGASARLIRNFPQLPPVPAWRSGGTRHTPRRELLLILGIGLAGFGTVGSGVWNTLERNGELITGRTGGGVRLHVAKILVRDLAKTRATTE